GRGSPRRSAPVLGRSNVGTRPSPDGIGRIATTGARCARGRAHSDNVVVRRHWPIITLRLVFHSQIVNRKCRIASMAYEFKVVRRVEFSETDMAGIVHYSNFFRYMEAAETQFFRSLGFSLMTRQVQPPVGWPRVHAECD